MQGLSGVQVVLYAKIVESQIEYLSTVCKALATKSNLLLLKDQVNNLKDYTDSSIDKLNQINAAFKESIDIQKPVEHNNVRETYIVDMTDFKSKEESEKQ